MICKIQIASFFVRTKIVSSDKIKFTRYEIFGLNEMLFSPFRNGFDFWFFLLFSQNENLKSGISCKMKFTMH